MQCIYTVYIFKSHSVQLPVSVCMYSIHACQGLNYLHVHVHMNVHVSHVNVHVHVIVSFVMCYHCVLMNVSR